MATTVNTGWREVTPGNCDSCGFDDGWQVDGRGNVMCDCQACPDCGSLDAYGFHNEDCPELENEEPDFDQDDWDDDLTDEDLQAIRESYKPREIPELESDKEKWAMSVEDEE